MLHEEHLHYIKQKFKSSDYSELFFLNHALKDRQLLKLHKDYQLDVLPIEERELYHDGWAVWEYSDVLQGEGDKRLGVPTLSRPQHAARMTKALFLDRDGVVTVDHGYVKSFKDTSLVGGVVELLQEMKKQNYLFFVLTNQSGVARGKFEMKDVHNFHQDLAYELDKFNVKIERFETCPYHFIPEEVERSSFVRHSYLRKPYPGMIFQVAKDYYLDINHMRMVGDRPSDGLLLPGLKSYFLKGAYPLDGVAKEKIFNGHGELLRQFLSELAL